MNVPAFIVAELAGALIAAAVLGWLMAARVGDAGSKVLEPGR